MMPPTLKKMFETIITAHPWFMLQNISILGSAFNERDIIPSQSISLAY